jgi:hypothetical protein
VLSNRFRRAGNRRRDRQACLVAIAPDNAAGPDEVQRQILEIGTAVDRDNPDEKSRVLLTERAHISCCYLAMKISAEDLTAYRRPKLQR